MAEDNVTITISRRALDALVGLKREGEEVDAFLLHQPAQPLHQLVQ